MNSEVRWVLPESFMRKSAFKQGFVDARAELGFRQGYECMNPDDQWSCFVLGRVVSREALDAFDAVSG